MMAQSFVVVAVVAVLLGVTAVAQKAPAPSSVETLNITALLEKGGQFTRLIRLMSETQVATQIQNQINNSHDGITVFAPTDNAFDNLKAGLLNNLSNQQQVDLLQYHIIPKCYTLENMLTVSNPVRTQYAEDGLDIIGKGQQVNVTTTSDQVTQLNNVLRKDCPLIVYVVDIVLLPKSLFIAKAPASAPPPATSSSTSNSTTNTKTNSTSSDSGDNANTASSLSSPPTSLLFLIPAAFFASLFA